MPSDRSCRSRRSSCGRGARVALGALSAIFCCAPAVSVLAEPPAITKVRSRRAELYYRLDDASPQAEVELWYTRDRSGTWQRWGVQVHHDRPIVFEAPAEGLYGFYLIVYDNGQASSEPPGPETPAQRRIFIDYTPPLVQWDSIEAGNAFASRRIVQLRWTAHDSNFPSRPVSLSYQSSIDQTWHIIGIDLPNTGQFDWRVPDEAAGQVTLKLAVRDLGGHIVDRLHGPVPIDRWLEAGIDLPERQPTTHPASPGKGAPQTPGPTPTGPNGLSSLAMEVKPRATVASRAPIGVKRSA